MSSGPEKNVEDAIKRHLISVGAWFVKIYANAQQGIGYPDIIACYKGHFLALEVKAPNGRTAKIQTATLTKIEHAGGIIARPRSLQHVKDIIATLDAEGP